MLRTALILGLALLFIEGGFGFAFPWNREIRDTETSDGGAAVNEEDLLLFKRDADDIFLGDADEQNFIDENNIEDTWKGKKPRSYNSSR